MPILREVMSIVFTAEFFAATMLAASILLFITVVAIIIKMEELENLEETGEA